MQAQLTARDNWRFQSDTAAFGDYLALLKPTVMMLVVFTAWVGFVLAPGGLNPLLGFFAILCIAMGAGAAGALNMWWEWRLDARMSRTQSRPLPQGRIQPGEALGFGLFLSVFSVSIMGLLINALAACGLAFTIFFYAVIYTMILKPRTPQNIVIGGAAGAFPPVIGWWLVSPDVWAWQPWTLFLIVFLWTPPHFWALSLLRQEDYKAAGFPMLPLVKGERATLRAIYIYTWATVAASFLPLVAFRDVGSFYAVVATGLGGYYLWINTTLWKTKDIKGLALKSFLTSIIYLFALFAALGVCVGFAFFNVSP